MADDDRRSIRYPLGMHCSFRRHEAVTEAVAGTVRDVSRQGCCLETEADVGRPPEAIEILLPAASGTAPGFVVGQVVQRQRTADGWRLGVEFRAADPAVKWELLDAAYRQWQAAATSPSRSVPADAI